MQRNIASLRIAVGFILGVGVIGPAAMARQPLLINPGPEPPVDTSIAPVSGVAHAPISPDLPEPAHRVTDRSGLNFTFHSPVEAFIVDPLGRREGIDPRTGAAYNEIPRSSYGPDIQIGPMVPPDFKPTKVLDIVQPAEGLYTLTVVGTGTGVYSANFTAYDIDLNSSRISVKDVPTAPSIADTYQIVFAKAAGSQIQVAGGFDEGGPYPSDFPHFLTYPDSIENRTSLPVGATHYPLHLFYGATIIPSSFRARLNGVDITALFHPAAGTGEKVLLDFQRGRNLLMLSVDGEFANRRMGTYSDRLFFDAP